MDARRFLSQGCESQSIGACHVFSFSFRMRPFNYTTRQLGCSKGCKTYGRGSRQSRIEEDASVLCEMLTSSLVQVANFDKMTAQSLLRPQTGDVEREASLRAFLSAPCVSEVENLWLDAWVSDWMREFSQFTERATVGAWSCFVLNVALCVGCYAAYTCTLREGRWTLRRFPKPPPPTVQARHVQGCQLH